MNAIDFMKDRIKDIENDDFDEFETNMKDTVKELVDKNKTEYQSTDAFTDFITSRIKENEDLDLDKKSIELYTKYGSKTDWKKLVMKDLKGMNDKDVKIIIDKINKLF